MWCGILDWILKQTEYISGKTGEKKKKLKKTKNW